MLTLTEDHKKVLNDAIQGIGETRIWNAVIEENAELIQAIIKIRRRPKSRKAINNLYEEVADSILMVMNASLLLDEDRLKRMLEKKILKYSKAVYEKAP